MTRVRGSGGARGYYLMLSAWQAGDAEPLHRFRNAVGVGKVHGPYKPHNPKHKDRYAWFAAGNKAWIAFQILSPYLTGEKLRKLERLVRTDSIIVQDPHAPRMCGKGLHSMDEHGRSWGKGGKRVCAPCLEERLKRKKSGPSA